MKRITTTALFTLVVCLSAIGQIHLASMKYFMMDNTAPIVNVYDIKKESLLKSLNTGEPVMYTQFSTDQTKLYTLGKQWLHIINVNTLETQKVKLIADGELAVDPSLLFATGGIIDKIVSGAIDKDSAKRITLGIFPIGISKQGLAVYQRTGYDMPAHKMEYWVFDANKGGKKANTMSENNGSFYNNQLLVPEQDGSIRVVDPLTGTETKKLSGAFDANAISEAKSMKAQDDDKTVSLSVNPAGKYLITGVYFGTADISSLAAIYDMTAQKTIYSERVRMAAFTKVLPIFGESPHTLFQRSEPLDPNAREPEFPVMPAMPDYEKMKTKELKKATDEYLAKIEAYNIKMKEVTAKKKEFDNPKNQRVRIFSDVQCTQEVLSVEGAKFAHAYGDLLIAGKELLMEIYDIKTKKLLYTIYLV